ncbi:phage protease [Vibrio sp. M260112]|uniref:phage protease n=1 Tax=Vibrio sp. M260112 TaxID=3020895 RepID=UPI002F41C5C0
MSTTALTALCFNMSEAQISDDGIWLPLVPKGIFTGVDGRTWNNSQPDLVVARFNKKRPFDVEHSTHIKAPKGEPAPAYGWILKVENRDGEIWGYTEWNEDGQRLIDGKNYAFYSPAFGFLGDGTVTAIASSGLTNDPNLDVPALNHKEDRKMPLSQLIRDALGLGDEATEQEAATAINSLKSEKEVALNRANTPDLNKFVPKNTYDVALNRATEAEAKLEELALQEIDGIVQAAIDEGKVAPADKEMYVGLCSSEKGLEQFKKFAEGAPQIATNRKVETPKDKGGNVKLEDHEIATCRKMGISQEDYLKQKEMLSQGE